MPTVSFTANLQRHVSSPRVTVSGSTVAECLAEAFDHDPRLRGYVLDEHGALRKHMNVFVDGEQIQDRRGLADAVRPDSELYVMQALSGG
ncbi:MoaD/ThiS family protein [Paraliomyxa miuraensis]|uniref:MoaD/ThiS family protein n=1 Tax=Paraliomyxa miuraensis TaxID=376150 RepID=UPI00225A812D|nr:MoaD/ThiS family protein [Paraliomyxa miuraensis]MCX4241555.1 MoaD/ThiS family protein [Paraliomyxa miuraensis]